MGSKMTILMMRQRRSAATGQAPVVVTEPWSDEGTAAGGKTLSPELGEDEVAELALALKSGYTLQYGDRLEANGVLHVDYGVPTSANCVFGIGVWTIVDPEDPSSAFLARANPGSGRYRTFGFRTAAVYLGSGQWSAVSYEMRAEDNNYGGMVVNLQPYISYTARAITGGLPTIVLKNKDAEDCNVQFRGVFEITRVP